MRCFYHHDVEAVGACKHCSRGLCPDCAADLDEGLACKGRHESQVQRVSALVARNVATNGKVSWVHYTQLCFYVLLCLGGVGFGVYALSRGEMWGFVPLIPGLMMGFYAFNIGRWIAVRTAEPQKP